MFIQVFCVRVLSLFQDVAVCLRVAAGGLGSGPPGSSLSGRPVGAVEGHTQERIQRPGQYVLYACFSKMLQSALQCKIRIQQGYEIELWKQK